MSGEKEKIVLTKAHSLHLTESDIGGEKRYRVSFVCGGKKEPVLYSGRNAVSAVRFAAMLVLTNRVGMEHLRHAWGEAIAKWAAARDG